MVRLWRVFSICSLPGLGAVAQSLVEQPTLDDATVLLQHRAPGAESNPTEDLDKMLRSVTLPKDLNMDKPIPKAAVQDANAGKRGIDMAKLVTTILDLNKQTQSKGTWEALVDIAEAYYGEGEAGAGRPKGLEGLSEEEYRLLRNAPWVDEARRQIGITTPERLFTVALSIHSIIQKLGRKWTQMMLSIKDDTAREEEAWQRRMEEEPEEGPEGPSLDDFVQRMSDGAKSFVAASQRPILPMAKAVRTLPLSRLASALSQPSEPAPAAPALPPSPYWQPPPYAQYMQPMNGMPMAMPAQPMQPFAYPQSMQGMQGFQGMQGMQNWGPPPTMMQR